MLAGMRRRNFLKDIAGAGVAGLGLTTGTAAAPTPPTPPPTSGSIKKGISIWVFPREKPIREAMKLAREAGFDGIELAFYERGEISFDSQPEQMRKLAEDARAIGLEVVSLATGEGWNYPLSSDDAARRERGKAIIRKQLELAEGLGVDSILVVPALVGRVWGPEAAQMMVRYETAWQRSTEAIRELIPAAEKHKVCISVENVWNKFLLSPLEMRDYVDQFRSPWVRAHLDIGNVISHGYAQDWILTLGPRIKRVHVKDYNVQRDAFVNLLEGDLDWKASMAALRQVNFRGHLIAELSYHRQAPDLVLWNASRAFDYILAM